jgi:hypothetical protein
MCRYVAILVYQGLIENVCVYDSKNKAIEWIGKLASEYGEGDCVGSVVWDTGKNEETELAFVHSH